MRALPLRYAALLATVVVLNFLLPRLLPGALRSWRWCSVCWATGQGDGGASVLRGGATDCRDGPAGGASGGPALSCASGQLGPQPATRRF